MMYKKTLDRIHERVNILNLMNDIASQQLNLEITYATIENDMSTKPEYAVYEYHDALEDIELRMSKLDEKYSDLQNTLLGLGKH